MNNCDQEKLEVLNAFLLSFIKDFRNAEGAKMSLEEAQKYEQIKENSLHFLARVLPEIVNEVAYDCVVGNKEDAYFQKINDYQFARLDFIYLVELFYMKFYLGRKNEDSIQPQIIESHEDYHRIYGMLLTNLEETIACEKCGEIQSRSSDIVNYIDADCIIQKIERSYLNDLQNTPYPLLSNYTSNMSTLSKLFKELLLYKHKVSTSCFHCQKRRKHTFKMANFPTFFLWSIIWPNELTYLNIMLVVASVPLYIIRKTNKVYYRLRCIILKKEYSYQVYIEDNASWSAGREKYKWKNLLKEVLLKGKWVIDGLLYKKCIKDEALALKDYELNESEFLEIEKYAHACDVYESNNRVHIQNFLSNKSS